MHGSVNLDLGGIKSVRKGMQQILDQPAIFWRQLRGIQQVGAVARIGQHGRGEPAIAQVRADHLGKIKSRLVFILGG